LLNNDSYYEIREALDINYCKFIDACGFLPIVLSYEVSFKTYFDEINIDGVVLTGGNDLSSCNNNALSNIRDKYEKDLLEYCIENDIPVLGICRGMQVIAEFFDSSFKKVDNQIDIKHALFVNQKSKYSVYLNRFEKVNSYHNFAIDKTSDELNIVATSEDGIIKAIEHRKYKIFGQMWHSEREKHFIDSEVSLIKEFFNL